MTLKIKPAHLQYIFCFMATPLDYPHYFYENADIFYQFFKRLDKKATYQAIKQTKNTGIKPSYLGEIVIYISEKGFRAKSTTSSQERKILQKFSRNTFLNLAAWYIFPLFIANGRKCPYMPYIWIKSFLDGKTKGDPQLYREYISSVKEFMENVRPKWWMAPYKNIASTMGEKVQDNIVLLVGMFLRAYEDQIDGDISQQERGEERTPQKLDSEIIEFLEGIEAIDKLDSPNENDNPLV